MNGWMDESMSNVMGEMCQVYLFGRCTEATHRVKTLCIARSDLNHT